MSVKQYHKIWIEHTTSAQHTSIRARLAEAATADKAGDGGGNGPEREKWPDATL